jgi:hypothetical protein
LDGGAGFVAAMGQPCGYQARNFLASAGDRDLLALLDQIEQVAEFVLCLEGADL